MKTAMTYLWQHSLIALLLVTLTVTPACTTAQVESWIKTAISIIDVVLPAVTNGLGLAASLDGATISAADYNTIQSAGTQAAADLAEINTLITAFQNAGTAAQGGILTQINAYLTAGEQQVTGLLPLLHISDQATVNKIQSWVAFVAAEFQDLAAVIPLLTAGQTAALLRKVKAKPASYSQRGVILGFNKMIVAKTGSPVLDALTPRFQVHLHNKFERVITLGLLQ